MGTDKRYRFGATVVKCGIKNNCFKGYPERTMLLGNVVDLDMDEIVTDHIWIVVGKTLCELDLKAGDKIEFNARVGRYRKGYYKDKYDYKLNRMTKIEVTRANRELEENEITTKTPPTLLEYKEACERKEKEYQLELEKAKKQAENLQNVYNEQRTNAKNGIYPYSTPLGYFKPGNSNEPMVIDPYNAKHIKKAFELFSKGQSMQSISKEMRLIYPDMNTKKLKKILTQHVYIGKFKYRNKVRIGKHEPLISEELFNKVQIMLEKIKASKNKR